MELFLPQYPLINNSMLLWIQNIKYFMYMYMCTLVVCTNSSQVHGTSSGNTHSVVVLISWRTASILNSTRSFTLCSRSSRSSVNQEKEPFHFKYLIIQGTFTNVACTQQGCKYVCTPLSTLMLVSEWQQILAGMFPHKMESLPRREEAVLMTLWGPSSNNWQWPRH